MGSRGEVIAGGASEASHRQVEGKAELLRDEGRPASSAGPGGHTVSGRFGIAPPGIEPPHFVETRRDREAPTRRNRDRFLALTADGVAPPQRGRCATRRTGRGLPHDQKSGIGSVAADEGSCSVAIDRQWRITAATARAAAWAASAKDD